MVWVQRDLVLIISTLMNFSGLIDSEIKFSVKSESIVVLQNYYYIFNEVNLYA